MEKYSFGIGDRFGQQGKAQLKAIIQAKEHGVNITPVWNKSHREHTIIGTSPADVRKEADQAVKAMNWESAYYVDADHINLKNVDLFINSSDFFTLDTAEFIGLSTDKAEIEGFVDKHKKYIGTLKIEGIDQSFEIKPKHIKTVGQNFLRAVKEGGKIYSHIKKLKGADNFITEFSIDEAECSQTAIDLLFILSAIADEGIGVQTIAPKFPGRFNKGVDYAGSIDQFTDTFEQYLAVIGFAVKEFGLSENLKLSIHSGSDKFSIYKPINNAIKKFDTGLHLKTAGTTWLEELTGLACSGDEGLSIAKEVYISGLSRFDELCSPYSTVIDIKKEMLPSIETVRTWDATEFIEAVSHKVSNQRYNINFRQFLHTAYKIAAEMGACYPDALKKNEEIIAENVTRNLYEGHIKKVFM